MNGTQKAWQILLTAILWSFAPSGGLAQSSGRAQAQSEQKEEGLSQALRDELARSTEKLQLAKLERPYFIAYRVDEIDDFSFSATCGSLLYVRDAKPVRTLGVELRVGNYEFDNTNFAGMGGIGFSFSPGSRWFDFGQLPLDDDYIEVRRQIWLATDAQYKRALEQLAAKKAALQNRTRTENLADFSKEETTKTRDDRAPVRMERSDAEGLVRELSKQLGAMSDLNSSKIDLTVSNVRTLYLNSEGTSYIKSQPLITLTASASTQAIDGMVLADSLSFYGSSLTSFPVRALIAAEVGGMAERVLQLRNAPALERYNGPVLFEGRAAAELFRDVFASALVGQRKPVSGDSEIAAVFSRFTQGRGSSFADKIGARVLPDFLSVVDSPTTSAYKNEPLFGGYPVDDDGVRARETHLVDNGILKTLLTSRAPIEGVPHSTGNHRSIGAVPSNLIVTTSKVFSEAELQSQFMELVKKRGLEYGVTIRELGDAGPSTEEQAMSMVAAMTGQGEQGKNILLAYKVYPDGREELVRGARLSEMNVESFREIVAASNSTVFTSPQPPQFDLSTISSLAANGSSMPLVSYVVPSLLFEDVTLTKPSQELPKLPFSAPPPAAQ